MLVFKRLFDISISLILLVVSLPVFLFLWILVYINLGAPVIFKQKRPGKDEKIFTMYKFRTMKNDVDKDGNLLSDNDRLTSFGKFLRSTSLDELPELWNVLKGDMSLVGPRPLLVEYLELYSEEQKIRHRVRPGITGWAQINGRNNITWEEKFGLDVWYVKNQRLLLDMKILMLTAIKVFKRENISQDGQATIEKFKGSN